MTSPTHFERRCAERGITSVCGRKLAFELKCAIEAGDEDKAQFVMDGTNGARIYRFRVTEGRFYVVFSPESGWPMTVLTQAMIRSKKWARKMRKRGKIREGALRR